jgi:Helix-turn-helix domain/AraC-like ligand binding domain
MLTYERTEYCLEEGDLVLIEPHKVHSCSPIQNTARSYHMMYVDINWCLNRLSQFYATPVQAINCEQPALRIPSLFSSFLNMADQFKHSESLGFEPAFDQFMNNARIEHSKALLRSRESIVDTAIDIGFFDQSQFHKAFVNFTAATPRQHQKAQSIFDNNS